MDVDTPTHTVRAHGGGYSGASRATAQDKINLPPKKINETRGSLIAFEHVFEPRVHSLEQNVVDARVQESRDGQRCATPDDDTSVV